MKLKNHIINATLISLTGLAQIACGGSEDGTTTGDGDGDSTTEPGDGDGDGTTVDGDGDGTVGDGDGDMTDDPMDSMGGAPGDVELEIAAPYVVTTNIEDGAKGVYPDSVFEIEFSEPMDRKSVEDAYVSKSLPAEAVDFSWNEEWTVLTVSPKEELDFEAQWEEDLLEEAVPYGFLINKTALSAGGETLGKSLSIGFTTARQTIAFVETAGSFNGSVRSDGDTFGTVYTGDSGFDDLDGKAGYYGTMTFNVASYDYILSVDHATVFFTMLVNNNDPEELGVPGLYEVASEEHNWDAVHPQIIDDNRIGEVSGIENDDYQVVVTDLLWDQIQGDGLAQFALAQPVKTDGDELADAYRYEDIGLAFTYWIE